VAREMNLALQSVQFFHTRQDSLTCRKILRHGTDGFTSPPKVSVLQICITLKNPSPSAGFEPANFGPMASTLIIRLPRTTNRVLMKCITKIKHMWPSLPIDFISPKRQNQTSASDSLEQDNTFYAMLEMRYSQQALITATFVPRTSVSTSAWLWVTTLVYGV
jgi:hypothetical protein